MSKTSLLLQVTSCIKFIISFSAGITDYIPMNCLLRISQGQTSVDFSIIIVSDGILEDEESFLVTLLTEEGSNVTETVTIIDSSSKSFRHVYVHTISTVLYACVLVITCPGGNYGLF